MIADLVLVNPFVPVDLDAHILASLLKQPWPVLCFLVFFTQRDNNMPALGVPRTVCLDNFGEKFKVKAILLLV